MNITFEGAQHFDVGFAQGGSFEAMFNSGDSLFNIKFGDVVTPDQYEGEYDVTPRAKSEVVLNTDGLMMKSDVTVRKVPYFETSNATGETVYIANEV